MSHKHYDVVILGGGFAGACQARHLLLHAPGVRVLVVELPGDDEALEFGEAAMELGAVFLVHSLRLTDYLLERHAPSAAIHFHWPRDGRRTETLEDYRSCYANPPLPVALFGIDRSRIAADLKAMNLQGGTHYDARPLVSFSLGAGGAPHRIELRDAEASVVYTAAHLVDAGGRRFLIGGRENNLVTAPEDLQGVDAGAAWIRVRGVDRRLFAEQSAHQLVSRFYATNAFLGEAHWAWMTPVNRDGDVSIGVIYHRPEFADDRLDSPDKLLAFLRTHHRLLYDLACSGHCDSGSLGAFRRLPRLVHRSRTLFSPDNWCVIGDAAYCIDAFYNYSTSTLALAIEGATEVIRAKLAGERDAEEKRAAFNAFQLAYAHAANVVMRDAARQMGDAGVYSRRIYMEWIFWFGVHLPMFVGKWHLDLRFIHEFLKSVRLHADEFFPELHDQFNSLVAQGVKLDVLDPYRADQLIGDYHTPQQFDPYLQNAALDPRRCNVFRCMKHAFYYLAVWFVVFQWQAIGWRGLIRLKTCRRTLQILGAAAKAGIADAAYRVRRRRMRRERAAAEQAADQPLLAESATPSDDQSDDVRLAGLEPGGKG